MTTCVCVASGPSLTADQVQMIESARVAGRAHVIVVNNTWETLPNADVLYAADGPWWDVHHTAVEVGFSGECWTAHADAAKRYGLCFVRVNHRLRGLSRDPEALAWGQNGGYQAINLAYHFGARRIVLAGYDMMRGPNGETHHHGPHVAPLSNGDPSGWVRNFDGLAAELAREGVDLINCSARTALRIPRGDLGTTLSLLELEAE